MPDSAPKSEQRSSPPGRQKIMDALKSLLKEKEFAAITWTDIAHEAKVNEGLIYKYFGDLRNVLFQVLKEFVEYYWQRINLDVRGIEGSLNKLRKIIWNLFYFYSSEPVFARILLLEVRNLPGYFDSETYKIHKSWSRLTRDIIEDGIAKGEIRDDISSRDLMNAIYGAIEHSCLPSLLFGHTTDPDALTASVCKIIFEAINKPLPRPLPETERGSSPLPSQGRGQGC
ncbi:MAG: hypothetical protein BWK80_54105 [Desulfobacteraceae bacterium IS3]|nr:MAG: hypothetical protein BWK80_54105 [Desulfobacteraceae bacterium IS3]HAO22213.1 TetR/AcrR family transcriptional regulator [Desulfobacteraceae bacterium]